MGALFPGTRPNRQLPEVCHCPFLIVSPPGDGASACPVQLAALGNSKNRLVSGAFEVHKYSASRVKSVCVCVWGGGCREEDGWAEL